ncbi:MAG: transcriptional regulator [Variovorax paradoxus]|uniref:Transcriptional regulator n=1 Tax=Variovorax paradoxus TaxID=34073 RepID=A0A2W5QAC6_VARPD|nr:MAG: transcriptional regulator [Variovorax paradoxus]
MEEDKVVQALAALAHPLRLRVFRALVVSGPGGATPGMLLEGIDVPATSLSFHLKELTGSGLQMDGLLGYLTENCCAGEPCAIDARSSACC